MRKVSNEVALGLDIGGMRIKTVALTSDGQILEEFRTDSDAKYGPTSVRKAIGVAVKHYRERSIEFSRIGVACAGAVNPRTGRVLNSPNFTDWHNVPLKAWVEEDFGVPVSVGNDANCAMLTEWKLGNAIGKENAVLLTFGTGIGGGLILNRRLFVGSTGTAAELGHFTIQSADGIECSCGNSGCFERYCSASALERDCPGFTAKQIFERRLESPFRDVLAGFISRLQISLVGICNIFDPDCILVGGGIAAGLANYFPEIQTWIRKHAFPTVGERVELMQTKFGNQSGAMGAALLAFEPNE